MSDIGCAKERNNKERQAPSCAAAAARTKRTREEKKKEEQAKGQREREKRERGKIGCTGSEKQRRHGRETTLPQNGGGCLTDGGVCTDAKDKKKKAI